MDSRLERRIKWWKEQLKRKRKSKQEDLGVAGETSEESVGDTPQKRQGKKRKWKEENSELNSESVVEDAKPISKRKKRRKEAMSEDTEESETQSGTKVADGVKNETKKKYILFVGNIPFSATVEDIVEHFRRAGIKVDTFRLLTKKSGSSKGCGFMELTSSKQHQSALKLHHTKFGDRRINIELSCGGGGKTEERTEKMKSKNKRVQRQRLKRRKKKTESQDVTDD